MSRATRRANASTRSSTRTGPACRARPFAHRRSQCGVTNCYTEPSALGSDRWCGLIGAHAAFPGENLLIATFGTATTLEALRADGTFTGGLIAPGWSLMMHSLGTHTAQLPTLDAAAARRELDNGFDSIPQRLRQRHARRRYRRVACWRRRA